MNITAGAYLWEGIATDIGKLTVRRFLEKIRAGPETLAPVNIIIISRVTHI